MRNYRKSTKLSLLIVNVSIILLFALAALLPWLVTWYVEVYNKDHGLPTVVMLTTYPCLPFMAATLFSLRKILKNILSGLIFGDKSINALRTVCVCCLACALITLVAGRYYMPFYVVSFAAAGFAVIINTVKNVFSAALEQQREDLYKSVRDEL